jgi:hypothetical protein
MLTLTFACACRLERRNKARSHAACGETNLIRYNFRGKIRFLGQHVLKGSMDLSNPRFWRFRFAVGNHLSIGVAQNVFDAAFVPEDCENWFARE